MVLIDEYDKPIIDHLGKDDAARETAKANRDILKSFLGTLKGADVASHTWFVFITGVSKFSPVSIVSDLNNLVDLSMEDGYAAMMGCTHDEVMCDFMTYLEQMGRTLHVPVETACPGAVSTSSSILRFEHYWPVYGSSHCADEARRHAVLDGNKCNG